MPLDPFLGDFCAIEALLFGLADFLVGAAFLAGLLVLRAFAGALVTRPVEAFFFARALVTRPVEAFLAPLVPARLVDGFLGAALLLAAFFAFTVRFREAEVVTDAEREADGAGPGAAAVGIPGAATGFCE